MPARAPEPLLTAFGRAVRRLRSARGWSQEDLADRVGIDRTYIGGVERGERNVGLINVGRIAAALNVTFSDLAVEVDKDL